MFTKDQIVATPAPDYIHEKWMNSRGAEEMFGVVKDIDEAAGYALVSFPDYPTEKAYVGTWFELSELEAVN